MGAHTPKTIMAKNPLKCTLLYFLVIVENAVFLLRIPVGHRVEQRLWF